MISRGKTPKAARNPASWSHPRHHQLGPVARPLAELDVHDHGSLPLQRLGFAGCRSALTRFSDGVVKLDGGQVSSPVIGKCYFFL